nr:small YEC-rich multicopy peptide 4 [Limnephilus flavicornis]
MNFSSIVGVLVTLMTLMTSGAAYLRGLRKCQTACPRNYDPVCANTGYDDWITFSNKCLADADACTKYGLKEYPEYYYGEC